MYFTQTAPQTEVKMHYSNLTTRQLIVQVRNSGRESGLNTTCVPLRLVIKTCQANSAAFAIPPSHRMSKWSISQENQVCRQIPDLKAKVRNWQVVRMSCEHGLFGAGFPQIPAGLPALKRRHSRCLPQKPGGKLSSKRMSACNFTAWGVQCVCWAEWVSPNPITM